MGLATIALCTVNPKSAALGKCHHLSSEKTPEVAQKIFSSSKPSNFRSAAITLAAVGFINPLFFVVAAILFIIAACSRPQTETKLYPHRLETWNLDRSNIDRLTIVQPRELSHRPKSKFQADGGIEKLLKEIPSEITETGQFTPEELIKFTGRTQDGTIRAFSSFNRNIAYPYRAQEVKQEGSYTESLFRHFATQAVGRPELEFFKECLQGNHGPDVQQKARHVCAFLKLLGDGNIPIADTMNRNLVQEDLILNPTPSKAGKLEMSFPSYVVTEEEIGLYPVADLTRPQAECTPVARFQASRTVTVLSPDLTGNVSYVVRRNFKL